MAEKEKKLQDKLKKDLGNVQTKTKEFKDEFKKFALKGNIFDMAAGIIIGGAFNKIVSSLVNDIITPVIGLVLGTVDIKSLSFTLREAQGEIPALVMSYGVFIQNIIDFFITALSLFIAIKFILNISKTKEKLLENIKKPKDGANTPNTGESENIN